jgi:hypothetical protein
VVAWVAKSDLDDLQMDRSMRRRIEHYRQGQPTPHID